MEESLSEILKWTAPPSNNQSYASYLLLFRIIIILILLLLFLFICLNGLHLLEEPG
jgi:amino acid permease